MGSTLGVAGAQSMRSVGANARRSCRGFALISTVAVVSLEPVGDWASGAAAA
jgi:hypothetical protein